MKRQEEKIPAIGGHNRPGKSLAGAAPEQEIKQDEEEMPQNPQVQGLLEKLIAIGESGDREYFLGYIEMLAAMGSDMSGLKPEYDKRLNKDRVRGFVLKFTKAILPEAFWLKKMIRLDQVFLISKAALKAVNQGMQVNFAGKHIFSPTGEKKGRIYLPPAEDGWVDQSRLLVMVRNDFPVRARRLLLNQNRLAELEEVQETNSDTSS